MWWKICKGLSALVMVAAAFLIFIHVRQLDDGGDPRVNTQLETPALVLVEEIQPSHTEPAEHEDDQEKLSVDSITLEIPEAEQNQPVEQTAYAGPIRYTQYAWEEVYRNLSQYPNAKKEISKNGSRINISNPEGETFYIGPGRIAYLFSSSSNQLFELTSYPTQTASRDRELIQEGRNALSAEIDGMSREEAEQSMEALMDSLFQSDRYHAKAVNIYGYTGAHLKRLHQMLYKKRADWSYFYKEFPSEAEDGLYYIEMQLYIDDILSHFSPLEALVLSVFLEWLCFSLIGFTVYLGNLAEGRIVGTLMGTFWAFYDLIIYNMLSHSYYRFSPVSLARLSLTYEGTGITLDYAMCALLIGCAVMVCLCCFAEKKRKNGGRTR